MDMTKDLLRYVPSGIGFMYLTLFLFGSFVKWLEKWTTAAFQRILMSLMVFLPVIALLWLALDDPPVCMYSLDNTTSYPQHQRPLFCNAALQGNANDSTRADSNQSIKTETTFAGASAPAALQRPLYAPLVDKRETNFCVEQALGNGVRRQRDTVGSRDNELCERIQMLDVETCSFRDADKPIWYSNPSRKSLNMTKKELESVLEMTKLLLDNLFNILTGVGDLENFPLYAQCSRLFLNTACEGFAPACRFRETRCSPRDKHCSTTCSSLVDCIEMTFTNDGWEYQSNLEKMIVLTKKYFRTQKDESGSGDLARSQTEVILDTLYKTTVSRHAAKHPDIGVLDYDKIKEKLLDWFFHLLQVIAINGKPFHLPRRRRRAVTKCQEFFFKYNDFVPEENEDVMCIDVKGDSLERSRWLRVQSYAHSAQDAFGKPLALTAADQLKYPWSCVQREKNAGGNSSIDQGHLACPPVCLSGHVWTQRLRFGMVATVWTMWALYMMLVGTLYWQHNPSKDRELTVGDTLRSVPKSLWIRIIVPFALNFVIMIPLLIKMSVLFEANPQTWKEDGVDKNLALLLILCFITISVYQLYTVSSSMCGGMNTIRRQLKIKHRERALSDSQTPTACSCKKGPVKWYSSWCGFRHGHLFFLKMILLEIWEWSIQLATFQSLVASQHISYLYVSMAILLLNILVSPWVFLFRSRSSFMREVIFIVDIVLDLCYAMIGFYFLNHESDLRQTVFLLGFVPIPAVYTGILWPSYSLIKRTQTLFGAFLRNFATASLAPSSKRFTVLESGTVLQSPSLAKIGTKTRKHFSMFALLPMEETEETTVAQPNKPKSSNTPPSKSKCFTCSNFVAKVTNVPEEGFRLHLKVCELFFAFSTSLVVLALIAIAFYTSISKDYACADVLVAELRSAGMDATQAAAAAALWWNAYPRIVAAKWRKNLTYQRNPFVSYVDCQFHLVETVVVKNDGLRALPTLPVSMSRWSKLNHLDLRDNQLRSLPQEMFGDKMRQLSTVMLSGNPVHDVMLDLSNQHISEFPVRLCNLSSPEPSAANFGQQRWEWDIGSVSILNLRNNSLQDLPINLAECLPCMKKLMLGENPLVQPITLSLFEVWETLIGPRFNEETKCSADGGKSCAHEQWYGTDNSYDLRRYPKCKDGCPGEHFVLDVGGEDPDNPLQVDWSNLLVPMSARCSGTKSVVGGCGAGEGDLRLLSWSFFNQQCGAIQNATVQKLNVRCSGLVTLDLITLSTLADLEHVDLSENSFGSKDLISVQVPWLPADTRAPLPRLWYTLRQLIKLKSFKMESSTLDAGAFKTFAAIWLDILLGDKNMIPGKDFSVNGSQVSELDWGRSTMPGYSECMSNCAATIDKFDTERDCCFWDNAEQTFLCGFRGQKTCAVMTVNSFRPPLWLLHQLSPTLRFVSLKDQQYPVSGDAVLRALCNDVLNTLDVSKAFVMKTTLPDCLWNQVSLTQFEMLRSHGHGDQNFFDENSDQYPGMTRGDMFLVESWVPSSLVHLENLVTFRCCDNYEQTKVTAHMKEAYVHGLTGEFPQLPTSLQILNLGNNKLEGPIPLQWCTLHDLTVLRLYSLPNLNGSIPSCLGQLRNVYILSFENLAGVSGEIPWNTFRKTFSQSTINGKTLLLGLRLSISRTNFTGNLLPSRFPKNCRLTYIYIKVNHASLPIRISPTISRCPLVNIKIEGKAFAGDLPPEICGMCTLEEFDLGYSDTMQAVLKDVSTFSTESVDWLHRNCTNAERKRRCGKKKPKSWVTSFRKLRVQCFNVNPKCGLCHCKGDSSYTFAPLTSGNFTIGSAYANTNNGNWNPLTLVTITLSGTVLKTLMAGAVKYQVYQTAVPSFISSGSSNYFTCDNMECDLAKPIALTLDTPSKPNGSRYTLQFDFVIPEKVGQSNEFRVVIWGQDENHSLNDFTTTLKFKLG